MIVDGEIEPQGTEKGWINLEKRVPFNKMDAEKRKEICRKGQQAVMQLHGEKKSAKESLEKILTIKVTDGILSGADVPTEIIERIKRDNPNMTLYDLIQVVAVGKAVGGNMKAYELVRDTHGDKPQDKLQVDGLNVMTDADRAMLEKISERIEKADDVLIVKDVKTDQDEDN